MHVCGQNLEGNKQKSYVGGLFVFTYFICFLYLEALVNLQIQDNSIKAMKWKPQNHVETQKQGNDQHQGLVSGSFSELSPVSELSLHNTIPVVL